MRRLAPTLVSAIALALLAPAPAGAAFGLHDFDVTYTGPGGEILSQAGAHPFAMTTSLRVNAEETSEGGEFPEEPVRSILATQMPGFAASATAVPVCSMAEFFTPSKVNSVNPGCPADTAVGVVANQLANKNSKATTFTPVFNLAPAPGTAARLGFWVTAIPVTIDARVSETPPNLIVAGPTNLSQLVEVIGAQLTLWGVPADPRHDPLRADCLTIEGNSTGDCPSSAGEVPFITMPRACQGPLRSTYDVISWLGSSEEGEALTHDKAGNPEGMSNCDALAFSPDLSAAPSSRQAASPSGMQIDTHFTDEGLTNPTGLGASDVQEAVLTMPEGMTLNPSQAEGLATCSREQLERETASL